MNFIEAVQALKDGKCEAIFREGETGPFKKKGSELDKQVVVFSNILADDWQLINPTPQTETVDVERFMCGQCQHIHLSERECVNCCEETATCRAPIIKLTGTYQRESKMKVKRREGISVYSFEWVDKAKQANGEELRCYAEWEE